MRFIANILTDDLFDGDSSELYNITSERSSLVPGIPTLIIGWERTKKEYPDASIIEFEVADNVYWTYGKYERRDKYEDNLKKFYNLSIKKFINSIEYKFYDIILTGRDRFNGFIASLRDENEKTAYASDDMLYIYYNGKNFVIGLSLRDCDYLDESFKKQIFSAVYSSDNVHLIKNNDDIPRGIRYKIKDRAYLLPYIFS